MNRHAPHLQQNRRWRAGFAAFAILVPALLQSFFYPQQQRLRALADHGEAETAVVVGVTTTRRGSVFAEYAYEVDGERHSWSVDRRDVPHPIGESFAITYLPERPSLSRPGFPYTLARLEAEQPWWKLLAFLLVPFVFFAACAVLCHVRVRSVERSR